MNDDFLEPSFSSGISRRILVVRHITEIRKSPIDVTLSDASMYNPSIAIEQGVIRGAVDTGQANTYLTWVEGKYNTANASSKLLSNTIEVINMDLYRHEEKGLTEIKSEDHTIFYKTNSQGESILLQEYLIMKARKKNEDPPPVEAPKREYKFECQICRNGVKRYFGDMTRHVRDQHKITNVEYSDVERIGLKAFKKMKAMKTKASWACFSK